METDGNAKVGISFKDVKKAMDTMEAGKLPSLTVIPPEGLMGSLFMEAFRQQHQVGEYVLEVSIKEKNSTAVCQTAVWTKKQVPAALEACMHRQAIPDVSGWEKTFPGEN